MVTATSKAQERQPGGRVPAPGDLGLVQAFTNTRWNLDGDHGERFTSPTALAEWFAARDLIAPSTRLDQADLQRVFDVREGVRALLFVNNGEAPDQAAIKRLNAGLRSAGVYVQLDPQAPPHFTAPRRDLDGALAVIAAIVAAAQIDGSWERLKACPGGDCGWAFYDHSRNQNSNWCSMAVCGSREKAREYRRRQRGGT